MNGRAYNQIMVMGADFLRKLGYSFNEKTHPSVVKMQEEIASLENGSINFKIENRPDGTWSAESTNVDGLMTGGDNPKEIPTTIKDAIFTYYEVPPHLCVDGLLRSDNEPATVEQNIHIGA